MTFKKTQSGLFICQLLQSLSVQRRSQSQSSFLSFALRPEISDIFSQLSGVYLLIQQLCNVTATVFPLLLPLSLPFHPIITQGTSILSSHMRRKCSCGISHHVISGATMLGALKSCSCWNHHIAAYLIDMLSAQSWTCHFIDSANTMCPWVAELLLHVL